MVFQNPFGSLNPRQTIGAALEEPLLVNTDDERRRAARRRARHDGEGGLAARVPSSLSAYVFRRPAPAHRDRARAHAAPEDPGARRAGVGARRLDPRAGAESARRSAGRVPARLCVRLARPVGGASHRRRSDGDLPRPRRRDRIANKRSSRRRSIPIRARCCRRRRSPSRGAKRERIILAGEPPSPFDPPPGCAFHPRCPLAFERCRTETPSAREPAGTGRRVLGGRDDERDLRLHRHRRRHGRLPDGEPPQRRPAQPRADPRGGRPRQLDLAAHSRRLSLCDRQRARRLALSHRAAGGPERPRHRLSARQGDRRLARRSTA